MEVIASGHAPQPPLAEKQSGDSGASKNSIPYHMYSHCFKLIHKQILVSPFSYPKNFE
jgi:hypothetical protein